MNTQHSKNPGIKYFGKLHIVFTLLLLVFANSCQRDLDYIVAENNVGSQITSPVPVNSSLQGKVSDENNNPVSGATVRSGTNTTTTDSKGIFRFNNIPLDKYASVVSVDYPGYFKGIRTFAANYDGSVNYVKLKLVRKSLAGTVDAALGGIATLADNSSVSIVPNSIIIKNSGTAYTGAVNVFAAIIDPTSADIPQKIPGSFQATDSNNSRVILKSYGMIAVQLESPSGELLQLASGKTARLHVAIPASILSSAATTIPLWSLNETDGLWKREAEAVKAGNFYDGDVNHFSFWNCDYPFSAVYLELTVHSAGVALPGALVRITRPGGYGSAYGYTDSLGYVGGFVYNGEQLTLEILTDCMENVYSDNVGPFSSNTNLGVINVSVAADNSVTVSGYAVNCTNQPVSNGTAVIYFEGWPYYTHISGGSFSTTIIRCTSSNDSLQVIAYDIDSLQASPAWAGTVGSGNVITDTLSACGFTNPAEHITYTLDGVNYSITSDLGVSINVGVAPVGQLRRLSIGFYDSNLNHKISIGFVSEPEVPGLYTLDINRVNQYDSVSSVTPTLVNVTTYGGFNEPVIGSFTGQFQDSAAIIHAISGEFMVLGL